MWQSILLSNNDLIFLRSLDSERRKRQHLKNQVQWYGRRESKHLSVPTTKMEKRAATKVRWATLCLTITKQAFRKDDSVERKPTILAHSTAKENDKRMVKSFTSEHRPKRKVHIQQNPSEVSEGSNELAIEAEWRRPRLRSRKRGGGTATPLFVYFLNSCKLVLS